VKGKHNRKIRPEKWSTKYKSSAKFVIVQDRIKKNDDGVPQVTEVVLTYPDIIENVKPRLLKWKNILEMENIRLREATKADKPKRRKKKKTKDENI
tara:strand:+ start:1064 stop:1351 length:288 start_codon:yes stop_codon:yes gene_type:complete